MSVSEKLKDLRMYSRDDKEFEALKSEAQYRSKTSVHPFEDCIDQVRTALARGTLIYTRKETSS